jgi:hypothetical protein
MAQRRKDLQQASAQHSTVQQKQQQLVGSDSCLVNNQRIASQTSLHGAIVQHVCPDWLRASIACNRSSSRCSSCSKAHCCTLAPRLRARTRSRVCNKRPQGRPCSTLTQSCPFLTCRDTLQEIPSHTNPSCLHMHMYRATQNSRPVLCQRRAP